MDISPNALVALRPKYLYYLPKKKHPDKLMLDFLYCQGEFSVNVAIAHEKELKRIWDYKHNGNGK